MSRSIIGWDIGGANLKAALLNSEANLLNIAQLPCPLWRGLAELETAVKSMLNAFNLEAASVYHAVTMTGELVDCFADRDEGVCEIAALVSQLLGQHVVYYAANNGFVVHEDVKRFASDIASTNWHASASALGLVVQEALLIDIGSTTTDIIVIEHGGVLTAALSDSARLQDDTLVYTGVVRTPVMALGAKLVFEGTETNVMAEYFATMADVYRLTGELLPEHDMAETADGKGKTKLESARRLARMIGCDLQLTQEVMSLEKWVALAHVCRSLQINQIRCAALKRLQPNRLIIGAGAGAFLVRAIAKQLNQPYVALSELLLAVLPKTDADKAISIEVCLPAYAVANLAIKQQALSQN